MMKKNQNTIREGSKGVDVIIYFIALFVAFITLYPLYYVLILSLSSPEAAATMRVYLVPKGFYLGGYEKIFSDSRLWLSYRNTIMYAGAQAAGMLLTCSTFAYALSVKKLKGRRLINTFILIPMYFSGGIIPVFLLMLDMRLYNTPWALILPGCYSIWYIILMKSYFGSIPESLREGARIDGANHYQTLWSIYLPIAKPIVAVIALYTVVNAWNSWYRPALFLTDPNWQPLQLYLRRVLVEQTISFSEDFASIELLEAAQKQQISNSQLKYTVIIVSTLPMVIAYPFFQRYFVKGVMLGSLKG